jgi:hypothetical protein
MVLDIRVAEIREGLRNDRELVLCVQVSGNSQPVSMHLPGLDCDGGKTLPPQLLRHGVQEAPALVLGLGDRDAPPVEFERLLFQLQLTKAGGTQV